MRIDVVSIFPEYLAPLGLSLAGKAQDAGLLDVHVHDLRDWTHDRHRTVDDTPYGGGAGMVMRPEPWGEALDALVAGPDGDRARRAHAQRRAVHPGARRRSSPRPSTWSSPAAATRASTSGCSTTPPTRMQVREVSLGDYVLNGGEVAALVVIEAVVRLLPGFMGNPESLTEESHGDAGLLEYPVYTKPASWRGLDVPPVLLSRRPRPDRRLAPRPGACGVRRPADPTCCTPAGTLTSPASTTLDVRTADARRRRRAAHPAARLLGRGGAGQRRPSTSRRCARTSTTCRPGCGTWTTFVVRSRAALVGAVRGRLDGRHLGHRPADGRPRPARPRPGPLAAGARRGRGPARRPPAVAVHRRAAARANLRMYQRAGYRRDRGAAGRSRAWCT